MNEPKAAHPRSGKTGSVRKPKGEVPKKSRKKKNSRLFFRNWSPWTLGGGCLLTILLYVFIFYYFFVGPSSFRWKAMYGEADYPEGFEVHGIDVSHYQGTIDWERLRNADIKAFPVRFVFIKATEGLSLIDENFNQNFYEARRNSIVRGAYHFFVPDYDAAAQARFFLKQVHLEPGDLPPVLDVEKIGNLTPARLQKAVKQWLDIVEKECGVKPILYTGYKFKLDYLNTPEFESYPYWIAHYYVEKLSYKGAWKFWQHTDCGRVNGIRGYVDCNIFNGSIKELKELTIPEEAGEDAF